MAAKACQCQTVLLGLKGVILDRYSEEAVVAVVATHRVREVGHEEAEVEGHRPSEGQASSVVDHPPLQTKVVHTA
jgi:hypothetical protein